MTNSKYFEAVAKLLGVELGEEFGIIGTDQRYKLIELRLWVFDNCWKISIKEFNKLTPESIIKLPFEPKKGERYFYPSPTGPKGFYTINNNNNDAIDTQIKRNCGFFRTEAEAIAEAKKKGWIE